LIGREPSQSHQALHEIENAGQDGFKKEDLALARWFWSAAKSMLAQETIPGTTSAEPFALLLFGLKDFSQSDISDAASLLHRFVNAQRPANVSGGPGVDWVADYKPIAQKYLDDCRTYLGWKEDLKSMAPAAALAKVRTIKTRMPGPVREALSSDER